MFDVISDRFEACVPVENGHNIGSLNFIINGSVLPISTRLEHVNRSWLRKLFSVLCFCYVMFVFSLFFSSANIVC